MANYLMFDAPVLPLPDPNAGARGEKTSMVQVDSIHRTHIFNQSNSLSFHGFVPTDFQISLQSRWGPIFQNASLAEFVGGITGNPILSAAERGAKAFGASTRARALTAQQWEEPAYLQLSLPIQITAYSDTKLEIIDKLIQLSKFVTPSISGAGLLLAPGPVPLLKMAEAVITDGGGRDIEIDPEQTIVCQVGRFFRMQPCIVTNVIAAFDGQPEHISGNPMSVDFNLELTSYYAVTQEDIVQWFGGGFGQPGDTKR